MQLFLPYSAWQPYPAAMAIKFDAEDLIGELNTVVKTQLPYAGRRAMFELANILRLESWPAYAKVNFENPVPFTTQGLFAKADGLKVTLSFDRDAPKGQDPARYLYPTSVGGGIYPTRFTKALRQRGIVPSSYVAVPFVQGTAVRAEVNDYGNVKPSFYASTLAGLARRGGLGGKRTKTGGHKYFSIPDNRSGTKLLSGDSSRFKGAGLRPGIYRVKGRQLDFLFGYETKLPTVTKKWDFEEFAEITASEVLPSLLSKALKEALR
jgi:hypothetical protein